MKNLSLMERLIKAGYPEKQIYHQNSDLYVYDTPLTRKVLRKFCKDNGWNKLMEILNKPNFNEFIMSTFINNINGKKMIDCYGQYYVINNKEEI